MKTVIYISQGLISYTEIGLDINFIGLKVFLF